MTREDLAQVVAIERASFSHPWPLKSFEHELDVPFSSCLVVHPRGDPATVVGYVIWWRVADEIHLLNVAAAKTARGLGIGRWLAQTVLEDARRAGARLVTLEVSVHNAPARALYESLGFTIVRKRRDYYAPRDHALVAEWIVR
jgi:ribosomal-protein-alanine N-acetyltransferase